MKKKKNKVVQYISLIIGLFLSAVSFNLFFRPTKIAYGGTNGIAVIVEILTDGRIGATMIISIFYIVTFLIGLMVLDKKTMVKSILGTILYPIFVSVTAPLSTFDYFDFANNLLVVYIFGAILAGIGSGLVYKTGFSGGGTDILRLIMYRYLKIPLGKAGLILNGIIVITGAVIMHNYSNVMYAFLILYIMGFMTDRLILGVSSSKMFYIISDCSDEIRDYISRELGHGTTVLVVHGGMGNKPKRALLCVVPTGEYFMLKEGIGVIDPKAFFLITDSYEVAGGM